MDWNTPIRFVPKIGPVMAKKLKKLEIFTAGDLLTHIPFRYEDYSLISPINKLQAGETATIIVGILEIKNVFTRRGFNLQKAVVADKTANLDVTWFNQPYLVKALQNQSQIDLVGKVEMNGFKLVMQSPQYEFVTPNQPLLHTGRIVPIYPETAGITSKFLRTRIFHMLNSPLTTEFLPEPLLTALKLPSLKQALTNIHFPNNLAQVNLARDRLAFDELFTKQLESQIKRHQWSKHKVTTPFSIDQPKLESFYGSLPFVLTGAQNKVIAQILTDLQKDMPMNRLLQGDVGSGKTVVAAIAMYVAFLNKTRVLFMAPTEILAQQHFATLTNLLTPFGIKVGIQTGAKKSINPSSPPLNLRGGRVGLFDVIVGTHALLEKKVALDNVKLVIIDEQHRFGVRQRALLREKGNVPHVLTMTATPIPRTIALTLYGDLDLSVIDEMPVGRKAVKTWAVPAHKRESAYGWIRKQIKGNSNQAFIICPFIEPSESIKSVRAATQEFKTLEQSIFPDLRLALLHGKMTAAQKQKILTEFRTGKFDILVATPVVEVGIDIPTATIMLIEAAERFGLAQLHQLRGRVGRSDTQSYCLLFATGESPENIRRLKLLQTAKTGAQLAELDLKIRGPGSVYGLVQHGQQEFKIATFSDSELIELAQLEAQKLIKADLELTSVPLLKERVLSGTIPEVAPD